MISIELMRSLLFIDKNHYPAEHASVGAHAASNWMMTSPPPSPHPPRTKRSEGAPCPTKEATYEELTGEERESSVNSTEGFHNSIC